MATPLLTAAPPNDGLIPTAFPDLQDTGVYIRWHQTTDKLEVANSGTVYKTQDEVEVVIDAGDSTWAVYRRSEVEEINEFNRTAAEQAAFDAQEH